MQHLQISISAIVYASHGKSKSFPSKKINSFFSLQQSAGFHFHDRERNTLFFPLPWETEILSMKENQFIFYFSVMKMHHTKRLEKRLQENTRNVFLYHGFPSLHKCARCDYEPFVLLSIQVIEHQEGYVIWKIRTISSTEDSACYTNAPVLTTNHSYC